MSPKHQVGQSEGGPRMEGEEGWVPSLPDVLCSLCMCQLPPSAEPSPAQNGDG